MADSAAHLRRQIDSASDLHAVVRAMKAQAAASVGQYAQSVAALGDYARTVELGLGACFRQDPPRVAPQPATTATGRRQLRAVIFGSDRGLVGRFNETLVAHAQPSLSAQPQATQVWSVGARMQASLADAGIPSAGNFAVPATVQEITRQVTKILTTVIDPEPDSPTPNAPPELLLFYHRPTGGSGYVPISQRLLPLDDAWRRQLASQPWPTALPAQRVGDPNKTLRALISEHVFVSIYRASAESLASENASRLAAMDRADRNIDKMLRSLNDRFRRLRQSKIDEELSDVISGFKALGQQGET